MAATHTPPDELPRWDLTPLFDGLDDRRFTAAHEAIAADVDRLAATYDAHDIRGGPARALTAEDVAAAEQILEATNELSEHTRRVNGFLYARVTTDTRDDDAAGLQTELQQQLSVLTALGKRFDAWVARVGADGLIDRSEVAAAHDYALRKSAASARHQLSDDEEALVAELRLTAGAAWARLHRDITGRLEVALLDADGGRTHAPMTVARGLAHDPDPAVRRRAYEAELAGWESAAVPLAAALNGSIGERVVLNRRRGWPDDIDAALFTNNVGRETLDAMLEAVVDSLPHFRRFLKSKAAALGHGAGAGLPWSDLFAPIGAADSAEKVGWNEATANVRSAFETYGTGLAGLADRAFDAQWVDAGPRSGKVGGAYCLPIGNGESRVLMNFDGSFDSVQTLAHELGHAYHNTQLAERTALQRQTPMALAETASIFCETLMVHTGLAAASPTERVVLLNTDLQGATQVVVDIYSRFLFESALCARRARRTLSVDELCELMDHAQQDSYGDGLDEAHRHPYMWAVKGHYFTPFYNWPYTFGLLFGLGLFARYQADADSFRAGYDDLLASTGMDDAETLARRFDIDVRDTEFWASSLRVLVERIDEFEVLTAVTPPAPSVTS